MCARSANISFSLVFVISCPKTVIEPESGQIRPLTNFISTDLPQPAGPRIISVWPAVHLERDVIQNLLAVEANRHILEGRRSARPPQGCGSVDWIRRRPSWRQLPKIPIIRRLHQKVDDDDEYRRNHHRLRCCPAYALGSAGGAQPEVAADRGDDETRRTSA